MVTHLQPAGSVPTAELYRATQSGLVEANAAELPVQVVHQLVDV